MKTAYGHQNNKRAKAPNGIAAILTATNFNSNGGALVLAVTEPSVAFADGPPDSPPGSALRISAVIAVANGTVFELAYQFVVNAVAL